ncbi:MAG TPA: antitoxin Xre/MbcA/ParS toxin-binding domain-containing protein, partial [Longimicrobium sp.]
HRWRRGEVVPTAVFLGRLNSLGDLLTELNRTFGGAGHARDWLTRPVPALQQRTPREVILAGQMDRITGLLYALNAGIPT